MIIDMKLAEEPFKQIKEGTKKIELRLFDEKRAKINLGDEIVFHLKDNFDKTVKTKAIGLIRYGTFNEFFRDIDYKLAGDFGGYEETLKLYRGFYSEEDEAKYGVLGIRIELI